MDYCQVYLGTSLRDLTYQDVIDYFSTERLETEHLEFKSYNEAYGNFNKNLNGVIRAICGMLNSDGGVVIWGAPSETENDNGVQVCVGELSVVNEFMEVDRLISRVSDLIIPLPITVSLEILENEGSYVYIFEIGKSNYSPHQFQNIYYARLDGQTKPAPHYLIDALFKKVTYPNIEGYLKFNRIQSHQGMYQLSLSIIIFNFSELQNERDVKCRVISEHGVFQNSLEAVGAIHYSMDGHAYSPQTFADLLHFGAPEIDHEVLLFNSLTMNDEELSNIYISLIFGGEQSPLKSSDYVLDFSRVNLASRGDAEYLVSSRSENLLMSKKQSDLNQNRESILRTVLGRD